MKLFYSQLIILTLVLCLGLGTTVAAQGGQTFIPGTYSAKAMGNFGDVSVSVTFSADSIVSIEVGDHVETPGIAGPIFSQIIDEVLADQTLAIDTVSGATNSSRALLEALEDCVEQAGGDLAMLKTRVERIENYEEIRKTADVIVIGGGGAGYAAATSAAEHGASVILIEKAAAIGGNTLRSGGVNNAHDPVKQKNVAMTQPLLDDLGAILAAKGEDFGTFEPTLEILKDQITQYLETDDTTVLFDSVELHMIQTYMGGKRTDLAGNEISGDLELVRILCENALAGIKWLEEHGLEFTDDIGTVLGALWPRTHSNTQPIGTGIINVLAEASAKLGVETMVNTKGTELIVENGKVSGVRAIQNNGVPVLLTATKGVVIATGGYGANPEMRAEYNTYWPDLPLTMPTTNSSDITGDGIIMGKEVGANLVGMGFVQLMPSSHPVSGALSGGVWGSAETQVFVNSEGKRFVNEYASRDVLASAALMQPDALFYIICDQITAGNPQPGSKNGWGDSIDYLLETESIFKADTLEELAMKIGIEPAVLVAEIDRYNSFIDLDEDPDFGKRNFGPKIEVAPFYATPRSPSVHHTMGGLQIDTDARVLNPEGNPIPGLYAAGEVTGGIHAGNRLGGNAITDIIVFGKIAGESVALEK